MGGCGLSEEVGGTGSDGRVFPTFFLANTHSPFV